MEELIVKREMVKDTFAPRNGKASETESAQAELMIDYPMNY
jgi:hypothetical protein